jgi:hypothetical protein
MTREERDKLVAEADCDIQACPPFFFSIESDAGWVFTSTCCRNCVNNRKAFADSGGYDYFTDKERSFLRSAWSGKSGFIGEAGCKLPRKLRPDECLEWNCHQYVFFSTCKWADGRWDIDLKTRLKRK